MEKKIKKLKLVELQKEHLSSKELRNLKGGACACASMCTSGSTQEAFNDGYFTAKGSS